MTTNFKLASTTIFEPRTTNRTADTTAAANHSRTRVAPEANSTAATRQDTAALSATSALSASAATPDADRAARVEALRQSIDAGTYYVSAQDVAASIIHSLL